MKKFHSILTAFSLLLLCSCSNNENNEIYTCSDYEKPVVELFFRLINNSNANLIGDDNLYNSNSISILNHNLIEVKDESLIKLYYDFRSNTEIYLNLDATDTDTIRVKYSSSTKKTNEGCNYIDFLIENVFYNDKEILVSENEVYTIIK